ncbi:Zn-dependent exopeptidase [Terfezia boudieri ATCC MYA-4762]|uniref:Zn-dependent exopeptidase n=1 Tax=Terfezia boudieri ATCC MYA-4762 TaxID=1051890 RepID=A0A3N4LPM8_9PEZI|nr:Zn-dependent exopeptidase [Terfezia boudieri ATCC MYA-4762]
MLKLASTLPLPSFLRHKIATPADHSQLLSLHKSLVEIPSITGSEYAVGEWLAQYLVSQNFTVETQLVHGLEDGEEVEGVTKKQENIFAYLGQTRETRTLLTSHIDVVPPYIPYRETASAVYGRGSCDAKASVAAQITAALELIAEGKIKEGDISLLYVVGEETTGDGMKAANTLTPSGWESVIFGEPTELKLAVGHKGIAEFTINSEGKAAHSGYPWLGVNANSNLVKVLYELDRLDLPASSLLGNSTINVGQISGGVAPNVVPAKANAVVSVRVAEDLDETVRRINEVITSVPGVSVDWFETPHYGPVELDWDVEGFETTVCSYGTDVMYLKGDHKKYLYGPGSILVAHGDGEFVLKSDLFEAVRGYKKLVVESLYPTRRVPAVVRVEEVKSEEKLVVQEPEVVSKSATVVGAEKETGTGEKQEANEEL